MTTPEILDEIEREVSEDCGCGFTGCNHSNTFSRETALRLVKALRYAIGGDCAKCNRGKCSWHAEIGQILRGE